MSIRMCKEQSEVCLGDISNMHTSAEYCPPCRVVRNKRNNKASSQRRDRYERKPKVKGLDGNIEDRAALGSGYF